MMARRAVAALAALIGLPCGFASGDIPEQGEYAYTFPVHIEHPAEYLAAEIPLQVYQSVSDPALRDLGVYNAGGQPVPRTLRRLDETEEDVEFAMPLGIVPLYGELKSSQERLRLQLLRSEAGASFQFDSNLDGPEVSRGHQLQGYIVDLRELKQSPSALDFDWPDGGADFISKVRVEDGHDLANWRWLAGGSLAKLEFEGTNIEQHRINLPREPADFLRITWEDMPEEWRLEALSGIRREPGPDQAREWVTLSPVERDANGRGFLFDLGGYPPIDRVNLLLPGNNVVVRAGVDYRHGPETGWRLGHQGLFYRIRRADNEISSQPAPLASARASQWRVRILSGQVDGDVRLRLGWRPDRLVFLSQGEPPFTLAAGRAQDRVEEFPHQRLFGDVEIFTMLERSGEAGAASLGQRRDAAGAVVMEGARTWTWRTVLVWIGLIAAVLFVGWLAWSLLRESKDV